MCLSINIGLPFAVCRLPFAVCRLPLVGKDSGGVGGYGCWLTAGG
ncbi:hypothetical protein l13_02300 [Neisseria weaveri ATCC 51223]|nr:hypothetical protein l13_02300 [Neisseria weaveri ATCC 51223]